MKSDKQVVLLSQGRLMNLGNVARHPSFVMSNSFANQTLAQIALRNHPEEFEPGKVHVLPKIAR